MQKTLHEKKGGHQAVTLELSQRRVFRSGLVWQLLSCRVISHRM